MSAIMEKNIPAGASEILLKIAGKCCDKDIRVTSHFRIEKDTMEVTAEVKPVSPAKSITVRIPCSSGAKVVVFNANDTTMAAIKDSSGTKYIATFMANFFAPKMGHHANTSKTQSYGSTLTYEEYYKDNDNYNNGWLVGACSASDVSNEDGCTFVCQALKEGTYEWTAYYWDE